MQSRSLRNQPAGMAFGPGARAGGGAPRTKARGAVVFWGLVALGGLGWFLLTPVFTVRQMRAAAREGNAEKLSKYVDHGALRESLKTQLSAHAQPDSAISDEDAASRAFGAAFAIVAVDYLVTPDMVAALLTGSLPDPSTDRLFEQAARSPSARAIMEQYRDTAVERQRRERAAQIDKDLRISMGYESLNRFVVKVQGRQESGPPVALVFRRCGLGWKLSGIRRG